MTSKWILTRIGVLLSLVLLLAVVAACSSDGDDDGDSGAPAPATSVAAAPAPTSAPAATAPAPTSAPAATAVPVVGPPKVNRLRIGIAPFSQESNVRRIVGQTNAVQFDILDEHLIGLDETNGQQIPELAKEWSLESGPAYRFKLQEGVQFHGDWGEMTADDVVFTVEEYMKEDAIGGVRAPLVRALNRFEIVNDHEVVFHMNLFDADFLNIFARQQPIAGITSKKHAESLGGDPTFAQEPLAATGPYQFSERSQTEFIRYERVPYDHWSKQGDFPEIEITYMGEASTRLAALLTDEIHITNIPDDQLTIAINEGMRVIQGTATLRRAFFRLQCCYVDPETKAYPMHPDSPMQDIRVRQALNKAVNRDELNEALFAGKGEVMILNNFHPTLVAGWDPSWATRFDDAYGYDPAAATALLAVAGYNSGNPLETNVHVFKDASLPGADDIAESVAAYFGDIGVKVNLITDDSATRRAKSRNQSYTNHLSISDTSAAQFTGLSVYATNTSFSRGSTTPEADAKFLEVRAASTEADQDRLLRELGNIIYDSFTDFPLFYLPAEVVVNPEFVDEWVWPGFLSGFWSHLWTVKGTR